MHKKLSHINRIHFVGLKGVAMTALAIIACELGKIVTGSDIDEEFPTDAVLRRFGLSSLTGFSSSHVPEGTDLVIFTGAHSGADNPEVKEAARQGIPVLPHGKALGLFMVGRKVISVAGSHGKTTTSAMLAHILMRGGYDPSFAVGCGEILSLGTPAHAGKGDYFVAEADEYVTDPLHDLTPRFMWQKPSLLTITNIDFDHPDVYKNLDMVKQAFLNFTGNVDLDGDVVINIDDPVCRSILPQIQRRVVTYGSGEDSQFRILNFEFKDQKSSFSIAGLGQFTLKVPGVHNIYNAAAAAATLTQLKIPVTVIEQGLSTYRGTKRRFELICAKHDKLLIDDYAHHPREIEATLQAARKWFPGRRIITVFQPHTFSRTKSLFTEFSSCFSGADTTLITEIYPSARETVISDISGKILYENILKQETDVHFAPKKADVLQYLRSNSRPGDVIIVMGAGNIYSWLHDVSGVL